MDNNAKRLIEIGDNLFTTKRPYDSFCQEVADNFYPMRADFIRTLQLGTDFATGTMEGTPIQNRETLGNALDSMLRQGNWFEITTGDVDRDTEHDNAQALATATRSMRGVIKDHRSNFDRGMKVADMDWVTFGCPCLSIEYAAEYHCLVYRPWHPRDIAYTTDEFDKVDGVHRKTVMTVSNICRKFDQGAWTGELHSDIRRMCAKKPNEVVHLRHILMPVDDVYGSDAAKIRSYRGAKWISIYVDIDHHTVLNEAPARIFNYATPRWRTLNHHPQGFSPLVVNSLPDARMIQKLALTILEQGEKAVDPPMVMSNEFLGRDFNLFAGGATYVDIGEGPRSLKDMLTTIDTSQGVQVGVELKTDIRQLLAEGWLLNKLFLPDLRQMTAYEASVRTEEFRRAALPFFTPVQSEYHEQVLSITFEMGSMMRLIDLTGMPPALMSKDVVFQYTSPLESAEGQQIVAAFQQSMSIVAAGSQVDNTVSKLFDVAEATIDAVRGSGARPEWILPDDQQQAVKDQAAQDKQMVDQAAKLQAGAAIASQLSGGVLAARQAGILKGPPGSELPSRPRPGTVPATSLPPGSAGPGMTPAGPA